MKAKKFRKFKQRLVTELDQKWRVKFNAAMRNEQRNYAGDEPIDVHNPGEILGWILAQSNAVVRNHQIISLWTAVETYILRREELNQSRSPLTSSGKEWLLGCVSDFRNIYQVRSLPN